MSQEVRSHAPCSPYSQSQLCLVISPLLVKLVSFPRQLELSQSVRQSEVLGGKMAQSAAQLDPESFSCSLCLDLLKDPVTISCGHSYCRKCLQHHWDAEEEKRVYSCPQCKRTFTARPVLEKNTMLAARVETLEKTGLQAAPADHCYAGAGDVACDVCTGRKLKALKSCLLCQASYCDSHLQPHRDTAPLERHKLVEPSQQLQENICPRHDEVMKMFCRTDQKIISYVCSVDEHHGHQTVPAAAERTERQRELEETRQKIQWKIQHTEEDLKVLQKEVESINGSADKAVKDSEDIFTQMIRQLERRCSEVQQQVRSTQGAAVSRVKEFQKKLEQELMELKRGDAELEKISHTLDHSQFLHSFYSLPALSPSPDSSSLEVHPLRYFEDVAAAVTKLRDEIQQVLMETQTNTSWTVCNVDVLLPEPEPRSRDDFLRYSPLITLDPNTVNKHLFLSEENRRVTRMEEVQPYCDHPDRFTVWQQVLSRESLNGRCYWEVERRGRVEVAVAYRNISRAGRSEEIAFGSNDKSWSLYCSSGGYKFHHNNIRTDVSGPQSSRVGVYLDHRAGLLSFYSVSGTMELLHRVQTSFTQPLHVGLYVYLNSSAELMKVGLKSSERL
ncbi:tripartite motif-containing protein 16-like [Nelusetta ayraudi]|uniref:tripartite motif-containing protein 16-like n=1 Tax=Nelusetta ayraudi TaxID=303726 RepID=UPI003F72DEFA